MLVRTDEAPNVGHNQVPLAPSASPESPTTFSQDASTTEHLNARRRICPNLLPVASASDYRHIFMQLTALSWPVVLYMVSTVILPMTSIIFSGHLGKDEIVASSLAQAMIHVFWRAVLIGFTTSADTLFSQTYGSKNKKRVGIILQRFLVIDTLLAVICCGVLLNTEGILLLFGQDPLIAQLASGYGMVFIAAIPADSVFILLVKYLESQSIVRPLLVVIITMGGLNILIHFLMVSILQYGLLGAVASQVITYYLGVIMLLGYIYWTRIYKKTWPGWSWDCLQEWGIITKLSIAGMGTVCVEWWCFEAGFFISGLYGKTAVGAHAVLFSTCAITWSVSAGVGIGGAILVGNYLGENRPTKAHITACCCLIITAILGLLYMIILFSLKGVIGYIFTTEEDVIHLVESVVPVLGVTQIFDSVNAASFGILRGCGYQYIGAIVCFLGYIVGLPLGVVLMFTFGYGLKGLWLGILSALSVEFLLLLTFIILIIKWEMEAIKAQRRAAVLPKSCAAEIKSNGEIELETLEKCLDNETEVSQVKPGRNTSECLEGGGIQTEENDGDDRDGNIEGDREVEQPGDHQRDPSTIATEILRSECDGRREVKARPESGFVNDGEEENDQEEDAVEVLTLGRLSAAQLVLRRGLALSLCLAFLVISILVSFIVVPAVRPSIQDSFNRTANYTYLPEILETEM